MNETEQDKSVDTAPESTAAPEETQETGTEAETAPETTEGTVNAPEPEVAA